MNKREKYDRLRCDLFCRMQRHAPVVVSQRRKNPRWNHQQVFWIYGRHATLSALANPHRSCKRLLITAEAAAVTVTGGALLRLYDDKNAYSPLPRIELVESYVLDKMIPGVAHQGIAAQVTPLKPLPLSAILESSLKIKKSIVLVLDQMTDPRNIGAVMRSAAAFGALAVVMQERHAPVETGALARAASGSLEHVPLARTINIARTLETFKEAGFWVIGLDVTAPLSLAQTKQADRVVLVLGSEGQGLRHLVRAHCDSLACLPITGAVESLNVSNAAAVALYEMTPIRSRGTHSPRSRGPVAE